MKAKEIAVAIMHGRQVQSVVGRQKSAVDLVLHEIRRSILSGDLPPGQPFTVPALTERLGVSHVPVREALRKGQGQGPGPGQSQSLVMVDQGPRSAHYLRTAMSYTKERRLNAVDDTERWLDSLDRSARASPEADARYLRRIGARDAG